MNWRKTAILKAAGGTAGKDANAVTERREFEEKEWKTALRELEELETRAKIGAGKGDARKLTKSLGELTKNK